MKIERLPVIKRPGFDCRYDHANCPACKAHGENDHGISGGAAWFAVAGSLDGGRRAVLVLEVLGRDFPTTIPESHWHPETRATVQKVRSAVLALHLDGTEHACDWMGEGGRCDDGGLTYVGAHDFYARLGNPDTVHEQSEAFWVGLERELESWIKERAA